MIPDKKHSRRKFGSAAFMFCYSHYLYSVFYLKSRNELFSKRDEGPRAGRGKRRDEVLEDVSYGYPGLEPVFRLVKVSRTTALDYR